MDVTDRFSDRVENYVKFRPSYPAALIDSLTTACRLSDQSVVVDIGSGTGKLSELLVARGIFVVGVEPNDDMRQAAEQLIGESPRFRSINGQAECTALEDGYADLIVAAQAFHWFDVELAKREFGRLLKPHGHIALIWNRRNTESPLQREYDDMLSRYCPDYAKYTHHRIEATDIVAFFTPDTASLQEFPYSQSFDLDGFLGRMFSSSYTPQPGTDGYDALLDKATALYRRFENRGSIIFDYTTQLYLAQSKIV